MVKDDGKKHKSGMVHISIDEYEELRAGSKMITDTDLINVIDKIDELLQSIKKKN
jgi:hypothetical protein